VSDEKLWDESPTSRHLQVLYHQTSFQVNSLLGKNLQSDQNIGLTLTVAKIELKTSQPFDITDCMFGGRFYENAFKKIFFHCTFT